MTIGIMGAMPEEINDVLTLIADRTEVTKGSRVYHTGTINGLKVVVAFSRWGKVAAATTATALIHEFSITELIFTGVAGAISPELAVGDIVIANRLIQHDMDARPLMPRHEIPLLQQTYFTSNELLKKQAINAVNNLIETNTLKGITRVNDLQTFGITAPKLLVGDIASGDLFFSSQQQKDALRSRLPDTLCVEMEGAAVAQVCYEYSIPFCVIRTISDTADDKSHIDFPTFIQKISSKYSLHIIERIFMSSMK